MWSKSLHNPGMSKFDDQDIVKKLTLHAFPKPRFRLTITNSAIADVSRLTFTAITSWLVDTVGSIRVITIVVHGNQTLVNIITDATRSSEAIHTRTRITGHCVCAVGVDVTHVCLCLTFVDVTTHRPIAGIPHTTCALITVDQVCAVGIDITR